MLDAAKVCEDSKLRSFSNEDFSMSCQEYKTVEFVGIPLNLIENETTKEATVPSGPGYYGRQIISRVKK